MTYKVEQRLKAQGSVGIKATQVIVHSLANSWNFEGGVGWLVSPTNPLESHYAIRKDGLVVQLVSENMRAEANYQANVRAISIETDSDLNALEPWTDAQVATLIELIADICERHTIPAKLTPAWDQPGLGWHIMWGTPGKWTPVAKSCPGPRRIVQFRTVIVPAVADELARRKGGTRTEHDTTPTPPSTPTPEDWFDMASKDDLKAALREMVPDIAQAVWDQARLTSEIDGQPYSPAAFVPQTNRLVSEIAVALGAEVGVDKDTNARVVGLTDDPNNVSAKLDQIINRLGV